MMLSNIILGVFYLFPLLYGAPDNAGTEFVVGFLENIAMSSNLDIQLFITTSSKNIVNVTVSAPRANPLRLYKEFTVTAGEVKTIVIDRDFEHKGTELQSKGILIKSSEEIVIYGINKQTLSTDGFLGLPTDVLGTEYVAVCYFPASFYTLILVVGVEDVTYVSIILPENNGVEVNFLNKTYGKSDRINVTMNRFDSLQISSPGDLTGAKIISNQIVAVFSGNKKTNTDLTHSRDHLVEQLFPVSTWGTSFATVPIPGVSIGDIFRFITSEQNTKISYSYYENGRLYTKSFAIVRENAFTEKVFKSNWNVHVVSNKPILLVQIVRSQFSSSEPSDPSMILIPPIEQYAADYTFTTPQYASGSYFNYVLFIAKKSTKNGLLLNGNRLSRGTVYHNIPNTSPPLVGGYFAIKDGTYTFRHTSPVATFGAVLFGREKWESYGFPVGLRLAPINKPCFSTRMIRGDGFDNDCDGRIDEEKCDPYRTDDDLDGMYNEDCANTNNDNVTTSTQQIIPSDTIAETTNQDNPTLSTEKTTTSPSLTTLVSQDATQTGYVNESTISQSVSRINNHRDRMTHNAKKGNSKYSIFLNSFRILEISMLSLISILFIGGSICFCKRCCAVFKRSDEDDDDDKKYAERNRKYF